MEHKREGSRVRPHGKARSVTGLLIDRDGYTYTLTGDDGVKASEVYRITTELYGLVEWVEETATSGSAYRDGRRVTTWTL